MNNKGFAITTILYGLMVLFCILLVTLMGILSTYKKNQELLVEEQKGARNIINSEVGSASNSEDNTTTYEVTFRCLSNGDFIVIAHNNETIDLTDNDKYSCSVKNFIGWNTNQSAQKGLHSITVNGSNITLYPVISGNTSLY